MNKVVALCLILLLTSVVETRRAKQVLQQQAESKNQQETVIEANHFSSMTEKSTTYNIDQIVKEKAILFYLKPQVAESTDKTLEENPITITLKDGQNEKECVFKSYTQLCVIPKASSQKMDLKLQCKSTPCEASWEIVQPPLVDEDGDHELDHLVSINKQKDHASLRVSCSNIQLGEEFGKDLVLYTNSKYQKIVAKEGVGLVFFLFDNPEEGYYFLTTNNQKVKDCANASLIHMSDQIAFNQQKREFLDYLKPENKVAYPFTSLPEKDFRIEAQAYDLTMSELDNSTAIKLNLVGYASGKRTLFSEMTLSVDNQKTYIEFSAVYKKPNQKYDKMQFQMQVFGSILMLRARFISAQVQQIELGELSFFDLKKGEKIEYKLVPLNKQVRKINKMHIFTSDSKFKASQSTCPATGCTFTLEAEQSGQGNIYIGESQKRDIKEMIVQPFENSISAKISFGEILYYSYDFKANEAIQLLVNVPGVVVYAATKEKCPTIDQKCYQTSFNHHFPAIYEPQKDDSLIFKVVGLDSCQFNLRVVDGKAPFLQIKDTEPFAYLFDDKQKSLVFQFQMKEKEDVSFNLIGPVNQLNLYVLNQQAPAKDQNKDWSTAELSSDGFIKFNKDQIKGLAFAIKVQKRAQFQNKFIHFTLIASTKEANLRLEPGAAHYETLKPKDTRDYVFEFKVDSKILLNFYTHNIHGREVKLGLKLSNADQYSDPENTASFTVDRNVDVLDIALASKRLCRMNEGENCQLFVRVQNQMQVEADVTITLLVQESIIQLKDGIWQSYRVNGPSTSSHFYFLPKHQNHSATIFYKPSVVDLRIVYNVWKSDDLSINLSEWPFPVDLQKPTDRFNFKPLQYIHIEPAKLKDCWPNCVILMSMITNSKDFQEAVEKNSSLLDAHFRIMASNNYIQLPEKHKVDILLSKNETKELLVDLKYYLQKEQIAFFTHYTLGKAVIKANVYSETNPRCPVSDQDSDFTLDSVQTILEIEQIKKKLQENSMQNDKNLYLCLMAYSSDQDTKFNIQFNSNTNGFKKLSVDTTTTLKASSKEYLYYLEYSEQTYIKITRNEGFPYYKVKMCKPEDEMDKCFEEFAEDKEKGTQLANKVTTIAESPCPKCILLLKVEFKQQTEIVLHTQSKFTELELAANSIVADNLQPNEQNRYTLTGTKEQEIIINLQVTSGNVKVAVKDFQKIDIVKMNEKGSNNIHITIPPKDMSLGQKQLGQTHMSSFGLSTFVHIHITVESQDHSKPASYTITYSSGSPVVNLQDGLITEYNLIPKVETKFIYKNPTDSPIYLYTSTSNAQSLKKLKLKYYGLQDTEDEDMKTEITPEKSQFSKKTVNPTNLAKLQGRKAYFFTVTNQNDKNTLFTIGVNNREIIYLPFDHEFPIELAPTQYIYLVINTVGEGYVKLIFSKCSISYPTISYTMNYEQFINQDYSIEDQMTQDLVSQLILKVKSSSGIYIKVRSSDTQKTLMSIKAIFSPQKIKGNRVKAGDKGLIQYQLLDSTKAEMTFNTVVCNKEQSGCGKGFSFLALTSDKIQNIYSQLVCPSIMFNLPQIQQLKSPKVTPIAKGAGDKITFTQEISNDIEYVGVKAVNQKTGEIVYYHPVEIVTFWGQLHRSSQSTIILAILLIIIFGCGCLMVYRRYKINEYKPVGELNDTIEQE